MSELYPGGNPRWVDMVEVTRCKDCRWSFHEPDGTLACEEWECQATMPEWFCSKSKHRVFYKSNEINSFTEFDDHLVTPSRVYQDMIDEGE